MKSVEIEIGARANIEIVIKIVSVKLFVIVIIDFKRYLVHIVECKVDVSFVATFKI